LVAGLSLVVNFILSSRKAKAELETTVEEYISALTDALKVPLWNYAEETIEAICSSYAQNEFVAKLLVEEQDGAVIFKKEKFDQRLVVTRSRDIIYENNLIGRVHIALASGYYTAVNRQLFQSFSLTIVIMIGALLIMTGVLLRLFLKKPISRFIKMVDTYAAGDADAFKQGISYSEFRPLVDVLDEMGEKIASQMRSLMLIQYAVDSSSVATYWINPDARITYVNEAACRSLGYSKDDFVKLAIAEIDPLWPAEDWPKRLEKIKSEGSLTFESVHRRKDGSTFPVEVTATFLTFNEIEYIFAFVADITHRKQAEEEIRKLNEDLEKRVEQRTAELRKLSETVEQSPVMVVISDKNGTIDYVNPRFSEVTGYSAKEAIGQNPRILKSGNLPHSVYQDLWDTILSGRTWRGEFLNRKKNGEEFWESASVSSINNDEDEITHFVAVMQDITEKKHMEEELLKSKQAAEEANKAKSDFLANMSHELRTPLNAILGYTELILDKIYGDVPVKIYEVLGRLEKNGHHLLGLINDVLDISKIEAGRFKLSLDDYSMQEVIQTVFTAVQPLATEKNLALKIDVSQDLTIGKGDEHRIAQVLLNLVENAIKFTEAGEVRVEVSAADGTFLVAVSDTGPGISEADQQNIFEEFHQADDSSTREKGGTGLGLSIVKRIIEMHGGRIWVESGPGKGSTFRFKLPIRVSEQKSDH